MSERIPPLQGLYYFYTAASIGSFKAAATQLFVTPAAISQQIRLLEEKVGAELFIRQHRKIQLTHEGETLFKHAQQGFSHLQEGIRLVNQDPHPYQLSISTMPSFTQHWLVSRIGDFRVQHPDIDLLIEPSNSLVTFHDSSIDICIRYGKGEYNNIRSVWLMDEVLYPVCHPIYQQQHQIYSLEDLPRADLIEDTWPDMDWGLWLRNLGLKSSKPALKYNGSQFVLEGALSVQGVALVKHATACRYIKEGKLVQIGQIALKPRFQFYLCAPEGYFKRKKIKQFQNWLEQQIKQFQTEYPYLGEVRETDFSLGELPSCNAQ